MKIKMIKPYKLMKAGTELNVDESYGETLIKKGVAEKEGKESTDKKVK